jgi:hypothetical protein
VEAKAVGQANVAIVFQATHTNEAGATWLPGDRGRKSTPSPIVKDPWLRPTQWAGPCKRRHHIQGLLHQTIVGRSLAADSWKGGTSGGEVAGTAHARQHPHAATATAIPQSVGALRVRNNIIQIDHRHQNGAGRRSIQQQPLSACANENPGSPKRARKRRGAVVHRRKKAPTMPICVPSHRQRERKRMGGRSPPIQHPRHEARRPRHRSPSPPTGRHIPHPPSVQQNATVPKQQQQQEARIPGRPGRGHLPPGLRPAAGRAACEVCTCEPAPAEKRTRPAGLRAKRADVGAASG